MRKALRWLLALTVFIGTLSTAAGAATAAEPEPTDIKDRILSIPGMSLIQEKPYPGYRYFVLNYTQPVDHRHPRPGYVPAAHHGAAQGHGPPHGLLHQRLQRLHDPLAPRAHPDRGRQPGLPGIPLLHPVPPPPPADWSKLDIWQAASDQHRVYQALKPLYSANWLATGGPKGGMTATYYERFYPHDMDGVVAYVAPNDVVNNEDSAYDRFFARVGTEECRDRLNAVQRGGAGAPGSR